MKWVLIISFLSFSSVFAQGLTGPVLQLMQLNSAPHGSMENKCREGGNPQIENQNLQQCMVDLCGSAHELESVYLTDDNFGDQADKSILEGFSYLKDDIESMANHFKDNNELIIEELESRLSRDGPVFKNLKDQRGDPRFYGQYGQIIFERYFYPEVDLSKPMEERLEIVIMPHLSKGPEFERALEHYKGEYRKSILEGPWLGKAMNGLYTPEEVFDRASRRLDELKNEYQSLYGGGFLPYDIQESLSDIEMFINDRQSDPYPEDGQSLAFSLAYLEEALLEGKGLPPTDVRPACQSGPCFDYIKDKLGSIDFDKTISSYKEGNKSFDVGPVVENCNAMILAQSFGSDESSKNFREKIPGILKNYKDKVLNRFSKKTAKKFFKKINNELHMVMPVREDRITEIGRNLDIAISNTQGAIPASYFLEELSDAALLTWIDELTDEDDNLDPYLPVKRICSPGPYATASDAFIPLKTLNEFPMMMGAGVDNGKNNILVSPFTCEHPHHGEDILSHELSHYVSYLFSDDPAASDESKEKFSILRQCAKRLVEGSEENQDNIMMPFTHEGDKRTTEEDTADLMAFMAYSDNQTPFTCTMLEPSSEGGYDFETSSRFTNGPHSFVPYRILNEAIQKNMPLSSVCESYLREIEPNLKRVKCIE